MTDTYEPNKTLAPIKNRKFSLLLVDDEQNILSSLKRLFRPEGYEIHIALGGQEGLSLFETNSIDLVISDMRMPDMDGAEFLKIVARKYPDTIRILLTGFSDITSTVKAINEGQIIQYFCKPWDDDEIKKEVKHALKSKLLEEENKHLTALTTEQNIKLMQFNELLEQKVFSKTQELRQTADMLDLAYREMRDSYFDTIKVFSNLVALKDPDASRLSNNVATLSKQIGKKLGLLKEEIQNIYIAGQLCEIGKLCIPNNILNRPLNDLNSVETKQYHSHTKIGNSAVLVVEKLNSAGELIESHEENFDGSGFPAGIKGLEIPLGARIISIVKDFYNLQIGKISETPLDCESALEIMQNNKNTKYDPDILPVFISVVQNMENAEDLGQFIRLKVANLESGMVIGNDLFSNSDTLLLATGRVLSEKLISRLSIYEASENGSYVVNIERLKRNG